MGKGALEMEKLLAKARKLNWILQKSAEGEISFDEICEILSDLMNSNVYVVGKKGKVYGTHFKNKEDDITVVDEETNAEILPGKYCEQMLKVQETKENITKEEAESFFPQDAAAPNKYNTLIPILGGGQRLGTLMITRYDEEYGMGDILLGEYSSTILGIEIERRQNQEVESEIRRRGAVQMAIGTLSYTEIEAIKQIISELQDMEGLVVSSKIADRFNITRSVVVNALRKLESAGIIESRSLGMKGTHIKILNNKLKEELDRLNF